MWPQLVIEDALLNHCNERGISTGVFVPAALCENVFRALHELTHHGYDATLRCIAQRFWWPRVRGDVSAFTKACEVCDRDRNANPLPRAPLGHLPADQPFGTLYIDIVGGQGSLSLKPFPKSILTMIDGLTGYTKAIPIADQSAGTCARAVYAEWIARYGVPESCTLIAARSSNLRSSPNCARLLESIRRARLHIARKLTASASDSIAHSSRCFAAPCSVDQMTGSRFSLRYSSRTDQRYLRRRASRHFASRSEEKCACLLISAHCCQNRLATCEPSLPSSQMTWSGPTKSHKRSLRHGYKRVESRYNERLVERAYQPGCLVRVLQHARNRNAQSKLDTKYSGLCQVLEVCGALFTLRELDTRRVFTANNDAVCRSTMSRAAALQVPAARAAPSIQYCAPQTRLLPSRRRRKPKRDFNQRSAQCLFHLLSKPLCRQRALSSLLKRISRHDYLLQLEEARAHCLNRERRVLSRYLARRMCCHRNRCTNSERVVMLAEVHMRPRSNRLCLSFIVHKRRKYIPSSTCECPRRLYLYK